MHVTRIDLHPDRYPATERYPFGLPIFRSTRAIALESPVTVFVGENGTGKSTLLRALAQKAGIHIWRFEDGARIEHNPYEERLADFLDLSWVDGPVPGSFFSSELFHDFAELLEEWATTDPGMLKHFGGRSLLTQSHGQSLMTYFASRYRIRGLYCLDEPETALSPRRQLELVTIIEEMGRLGHAQFVLATHSPLLMACAGARLLSFDGPRVAPIACEETPHYRVYEQFFRTRDRGEPRSSRPPSRG
jgi:predicted ATPase